MIRLAELTSQAVGSENGYPLVRYDLRAQVVLSSQRVALLLLGTLLGISVVVACLTRNTYDTGDSISHYLFARLVPQHPQNLLDAWAKPLFTLVAAGPAQAGFLGMKLLQCGLVALSAWLAFGIARTLRLPWPALAIVFCYAAPDYFRIQFSGLTEPLFGLLLVGAVALAVANRPSASAMLMSWLPFVRSEGALLWGLWIVYLVWNRNWRALPWLLLGYAVYSVVGGLVLGDYAWLFTHNPYPLHSQYGSGHWRHFLEHYPTLLGWPLTLLFVGGGLCTLRRALVPAAWGKRLFRAELLLIYGSIVLFTALHSVFWAYGLFGSFGLTRVMTVLVPLCAVAALTGLAWLSQLAKTPAARRWLLGSAATVVVLMVFSHDHGFRLNNGAYVGHDSNLHWRRDFSEQTDLVLADAAVDWLRNFDPHWQWHPIAFEHPYYPMALDVDHFDPAVRAPLTRNYAPYLDGVPVGTYVFWDSWFAPVEGRLPLDKLEADKRFRQLWHGSIAAIPGEADSWRHRAVIFVKTRP